MLELLCNRKIDYKIQLLKYTLPISIKTINIQKPDNISRRVICIAKSTICEYTNSK